MLGYKSPSDFRIFGLKKGSNMQDQLGKISTTGEGRAYRNGNIDYGYEFLGINSITADNEPGMIGGGEISDDEDDIN